MRDVDSPGEEGDESFEQEGTTLGGGLARIRRPRNLNSRDDLIAEVLAERGQPGDGPSDDLHQKNLEDDPFGSEEDDDGGPRPRGNYTYRGTQ